MTLQTIIARVRALYETRLSDETLAQWVAELDGRILTEDLQHAPMGIEYQPNDALLLADPWGEIYEAYLLQKIHFSRGEYVDAANFAQRVDEIHAAWRRRMMTGLRGKHAVLCGYAAVRRGSAGVVHLHLLFERREVAGMSVHLLQDGREVLSRALPDETLTLSDHLLSVHLDAEDTARLRAGMAQLVAVCETVAGEIYESDPARLHVLESTLEGLSA